MNKPSWNIQSIMASTIQRGRENRSLSKFGCLFFFPKTIQPFSPLTIEKRMKKYTKLVISESDNCEWIRRYKSVTLQGLAAHSPLNSDTRFFAKIRGFCRTWLSRLQRSSSSSSSWALLRPQAVFVDNFPYGKVQGCKVLFIILSSSVSNI